MKRHAGLSQKDESVGMSYSATTTSNSKQESSEIDSLIKQRGEMEILFAEAVTKVDKLEQSKNNCKNCKSFTHTTSNCNQLCKVCQASLSVYVFWKCPNYNITSNRSNPSITVANTTVGGLPVNFTSIYLYFYKSLFICKFIYKLIFICTFIYKLILYLN